MGTGPHNRDWEKRTRALECRVDFETYEQVREYAKAQNISAAQALREFIEWGLENSRSSESPKTLYQPPKWS